MKIEINSNAAILGPYGFVNCFELLQLDYRDNLQICDFARLNVIRLRQTLFTIFYSSNVPTCYLELSYILYYTRFILNKKKPSSQWGAYPRIQADTVIITLPL